MSASGGEALVRFLRRETGDHLHVVLRYDSHTWSTLYASDVADELLAGTVADVDALFETFRREGRRNVRLRSFFELGGYYCSLHLFDEVVLLHFFEADRGIIFGYDPAAASHLTGFVSMVLPYVRAAGLGDLDDSPAWETG